MLERPPKNAAAVESNVPTHPRGGGGRTQFCPPEGPVRRQREPLVLRQKFLDPQVLVGLQKIPIPNHSLYSETTLKLVTANKHVHKSV